MSNALRGKVLGGLFWSAVQSWISKLSGLLVFMVLARLLDPQQVGLFAAVSVVLGFVNIFLDQGLSEAIVQQPTITPQQVNTVAVLNMAVAVVLVLAMWAAAPAVSAYMHLPDLTDLLRATSCGMLIGALCFTQWAMQRRQFMYRWLAVTAVVATLVSGGLAVAMALLGWGVWSLVSQSLASVAITAALLWSRPQWKFSFELDWAGSQPMISYGLHRLGAYVLDFAGMRYIEFFIASTLGPVALGVYVVGMKGYQTLMQALSSAVLDVALNGFSRLAHDRVALRAAYVKAIGVTALVAVPVFCPLAVLAPEVTRVVFGERWAQSGDVLRPVAFMGAVQVLQFYNGTVLNAIGRPRPGLWVLTFKITSTVAGLYLFGGNDLVTMVYVFVGCQLLTTVPSFFIVRHMVGLPLRAVARRIGPALLATALATAAVTLLRGPVAQLALPLAAQLAILLATGGVVYLGALLVIARDRLLEAMALVRRRPGATSPAAS